MLLMDSSQQLLKLFHTSYTTMSVFDKMSALEVVLHVQHYTMLAHTFVCTQFLALLFHF